MPLTVSFILMAIGAYLLGSVPAAYMAVRWRRKIDIRTVGTGKIGASNVLRSAGKKLGLLVAIFDIGKGALAVWVADFMGLDVVHQAAVGLMVVVGHNWPVFLKFKGGGRGVFATLGIVTMFSWKLGLIMAAIAYSLAPIGQLALGVLIAYVFMPFFSWFLADWLDISEKEAVTAGIIALTVLGLGKRLIARRTETSRGLPWRGILFNRFFFDRDVSDRRLWLTNGTGRKG